MQGLHFVQSAHENRHAIEKVVYPLLDGLADVTLSDDAYRCFDDRCERRSKVLCSTNGVTWK